MTLPLFAPSRAADARSVLRDVFGYPEFRPGQAKAVDAFLEDRDVQVVLPTGGGKSLCFQVPAIVRAWRGEGATLVVSPLIALMQDQVEALERKGVKAVALHSGLDRAAWRQARDQARDAVLVYCSPERVAKPSARRALADLGLAAVAIDEAHCVSQWGHDFRPDYLKLSVLKEELGLPVMAVTATATPRVMGEVRTALRLSDPVVVHGGIGRENLHWSVEHIQGEHARVDRASDWLDRLALGKGGPGRAILYAATRKQVVSACKRLRAQGFDADHYHAGRSTSARDNAYQRFVTGKRSVMVATNAFGMGIDVSDVRLVMHLQAPGSLEAWSQEAGRAGRDGEDAWCVLLYAHADAMTQARLRGKTPTPGAEAGWKALQDVAFGTACRRQDLERWFLGEAGAACGRCDVCTDADQVVDGVAEARQIAADRRARRAAKRRADASVQLEPGQLDAIVAFVDGLRKPLGARLVTGGLRGSKAKKVRRKGLASNPQYGALKGVPERPILDAIDDLLTAGRLVRKGRKYPTLWIPDKRVRAKAGQGKSRRKPRYTGLEAELASFRRRQARRRGWKPYQVFDNATLKALASARPTNVVALAEIKGMGPKRIERYGEGLLNLILSSEDQ